MLINFMFRTFDSTKFFNILITNWNDFSNKLNEINKFNKKALGAFSNEIKTI